MNTPNLEASRAATVNALEGVAAKAKAAEDMDAWVVIMEVVSALKEGRIETMAANIVAPRPATVEG